MGWAIALHGGAGDIPLTLPKERREPREAALHHCLEVGVAALKAQKSPLDVVELVETVAFKQPSPNGNLRISKLYKNPFDRLHQADQRMKIAERGKTKLSGLVSLPMEAKSADEEDGKHTAELKNIGAARRCCVFSDMRAMVDLCWGREGRGQRGGDVASSERENGERWVCMLISVCLGCWGKVRELENNSHFNAGKGSVLTSKGTVEMEACIMDGNSKKCGAVSGLTTVVNAISLARLVMEKTPHIYLAFDGAEAFAREQIGDKKTASAVSAPHS
ncbi:unnamed protein product [Ilex paraguariensis]|uniref:beta-aspartyl-peptidase n=1 Tax=Ilex paraguariensis TaxID=185542 RepID=A0ABC8SU11_9AQUA